MKKTILLFTGLLLFTLSYSQITYSSSDYAQIGDQFIISQATGDSINSNNFDTTGISISWDFSSIILDAQSNRRFVDPDTAGYKNSFLTNCVLGGGGTAACNSQWNSSTNLAEVALDSIVLGTFKFSNVVNHYDLQSNSLRQTVIGMSFGIGTLTVPFAIPYDDIDTIYTFPMNFGNVDSSNSRYSIDLNSLGINFVYKSAQKRVNTVEGWGSITTPYSFYNSTLKLKTVVTSQDTFFYNGNVIPLGTTKQIFYRWFDKSSGVPVFEASGTIVNQINIISKVQFIDSLQCLDPEASILAVPFAYIDTSTQTATINFTNFSNNSDTYQWDFGDGNTSTAENPNHVYTSTGLYNVQLISCNTCSGNCDTANYPVLILDSTQVTAGFSYLPLAPCPGDSINFINSSYQSDTFHWDFGDGNTSTLKNPKHAYTMSGVYTVQLIASNTSTMSIDTIEKDIQIYSSPMVNAGNDTTIQAGEIVQLNAISDNDNAIFIWQSDPTLSCTVCPDPIAAPTTTTTYYVTASNSCGQSTDSITITIAGCDSNFSAIVTDTISTTGSNGSIDITVSGGTPPYSFDWNNDGTGDFDDNEDISGLSEGFYSVTVKDSNNCLIILSNIKIDSVVTVICDTNFVLNTDTISTSGSNGSIDLTVSGGTPPYSYDWDIDGTGDFDDNEDISGLSEGFYSVIVKDSNNCIAMLSNIKIDSVVTSGLLSLKNKLQTKIYPNPSEGNFNIEFDKMQSEVSMKIFDLSGKTMFENNYRNIEVVKIDVELTKGMYILYLENANAETKYSKLQIE